MLFFNRLTAIALTVVLISPGVPLEAKTRKGDRYLAEGRNHESQKEWDAALASYEKALSEDPSETLYQMAAQKTRFQASQAHLDHGLKTRGQGQLGEALLDFQKAYAFNPGSSASEQEIRRTQEMIQRERKRVEETGKEGPPEQRALTPVEEAKKQSQEKIRSLLPLPELKPINNEIRTLRLAPQSPRVLFETVAKLAGINIVWDPEYQAGRPLPLELDNTTLEEALDDIAVLTKSFWKPLSANTIFITNDNVNKRRDYEDQVLKIFYLSNVNTPQELQEIINAVRTLTEINRIMPYNSQNAIIVRAEADRVALAEKIIGDLDKPKSEVVVDIVVLQASQVFSRQITSAIAPTGLNVPAVFTPRAGLTTTTTPASGSTPASTTTSNTGAVPLANLGHLSSADYSITLPGALLQAALSDANTRVLQSPQLRSVDNVKASLKIGDREPTASGSFQPGVTGVGINPLVNTQFTYIDVGVNVDITPRVHDNGDVSMHVELDISNVSGEVNLGGLNQPIISQKKIIHDIRMKEGEVNLLGGLIQQQENKTVTGIPGLSSIPLLRRLFSGESIDHNRSELMIALIPHVVRRPEITADNLKGISVGNATTIKLNYAPAAPQPAAPKPTAPAAPAVSLASPPATAPAVTPASPPATAPPAPNPNAPPPPPTVATVHFLPPQVDATLSSAFTVAVVLEGGMDVTAAPMQIQFDPKILRLNDVTSGDFLAQGGIQPAFVKNIQNDAGSAAIQLNRQGGAPGVSGSGVLVTLSFQAVGPGATTLSVEGLNVTNSQGQPVATSGRPALPVRVQ